MFSNLYLKGRPALRKMKFKLVEIFKMVFVVISILFFCVDFAFSDETCLSGSDACKCILSNKTVIDLSSVGVPRNPRFYEVQFLKNCSDFFSYNPCFPFDSPDKLAVPESGRAPCIEASACVKGVGGFDGTLPKEYAIGLQNMSSFGVQEKTGFYINYTTPKSDKVLQVFLKCKNDSDVHELSMDNPYCLNDSSKLIILTLTSKCACAGGCESPIPTDSSSTSSVSPTDSSSTSSHGLSTGSKLLIAFFTILLAYLLIGIVWNYCNGAHGLELVPNIEFWKDLPTLMMEGVGFACSCCGRKSSYGEVL